MNDAEITADALAAIPLTRMRQGRFIGMDGALATVDMGDSRFPCDFGAGYIPVVNETVQVLTVGAKHWLLPFGPKPRVGTVLTVSSPTVLLDTPAGNVTATIGGAEPTSGDNVLIEWTELGPVSGLKLAEPPDTPDPEPNPGGGGTVRTVTFRAIDAGSTDRHQSRWWSQNPQAGNSTYGAWLYGTAIKDTIPASAQFVSLQIKVNYRKRSGGAPRWVLHNLYGKTGVPSVSSYLEWAPAAGWQTPPGASDWFHALKRGGSWAGVGLNQGGYNIFASRAQDSETGALKISWRA